MTKISKVAIAIKTKDRTPKKNYLRETLENMERAGVFGSPHLDHVVIMDSGINIEFVRQATEGFPIAAVIAGPRTLHANAAAAIRCVGNSGADWALVLEDDLDFCGAFLESVVGFLSDVAHLVSTKMFVFGANYMAIESARLRGKRWWEYPVDNFYGAQALAWKRQDAESLANWLGEDPSYDGTKDRGHDLLLQRWGREMKMTYFLASVPSFVQHIGDQSGIDNRFFQFVSWQGRDWRYAPKKKG